MQLGGVSRDSTGFGAMEEGLISSGGRKLMLNHLKYLLVDQNENHLTLQVHPFIYSYLCIDGLFSIRRKWMKKYGKKFKVQSMPEFHMLQYNFQNANGDDIKL